jgi:hypothetical protein
VCVTLTVLTVRSNSLTSFGEGRIRDTKDLSHCHSKDSDFHQQSIIIQTAGIASSSINENYHQLHHQQPTIIINNDKRRSISTTITAFTATTATMFLSLFVLRHQTNHDTTVPTNKESMSNDPCVSVGRTVVEGNGNG